MLGQGEMFQHQGKFGSRLVRDGNQKMNVDAPHVYRFTSITTTRQSESETALVHHHLRGHLLEIDFVYLEFCLEDSRCENSASQQVLKRREEGKEGR